LNSPRKPGRLVYQSRPSDSTTPVITAVDHILSYALAEACTLRKGGGCLPCRQTGYSGRDGEKALNDTTTVSEMVRVTGK